MRSHAELRLRENPRRKSRGRPASCSAKYDSGIISGCEGEGKYVFVCILTVHSEKYNRYHLNKGRIVIRLFVCSGNKTPSEICKARVNK